jgi:hypothetical protein
MGPGYPSLARLPPIRLDRVAPGWWPPRRDWQVALVCPTLTLYPCVQQYPHLSQYGLVGPQWAGRGTGVPTGAGAGGTGVGAGQVAGEAGLWSGASDPCPYIRDMDACIDSRACIDPRACISWAFVATSWLIVAFFWTDALARCSRDAAIWHPCASSSAALAQNVVLAAVLWLMSRILAKAAVQCAFQLWSATGLRRHSPHARVMFPVASACLVPVVTIVASEMGTPAPVAKP